MHVPPEIKKYLLRFGLVLLIAVPVMMITQGANAARIIGYKVSMITIAIGLAELLWSIFFKPQYGKTEGLTSGELFPILMFRGLLYGSIVLALSLGL
jgi:hypothetical protein